MAEARGRAQAASLRAARTDVSARKVGASRDVVVATVAASQLQKGDCVLVHAGETIPGDGTVVEGVAPDDESAITGESAPVIREAGGDRSAVTGGTWVISDWLVVAITATRGESFLDRMAAMLRAPSGRRTLTRLPSHRCWPPSRCSS